MSVLAFTVRLKKQKKESLGSGPNTPGQDCSDQPPRPTNLAAKQLQLERDSLVPLGRIYSDVARLNRRKEVISHLVQVVHVALKNLP